MCTLKTLQPSLAKIKKDIPHIQTSLLACLHTDNILAHTEVYLGITHIKIQHTPGNQIFK